MVPRLLRLYPNTYQRLTRLSKEAERDGAYRVAKRLRAVVLNSEGRTNGELAQVLQAPRSCPVIYARMYSRSNETKLITTKDKNIQASIAYEVCPSSLILCIEKNGLWRDFAR